MKSSVTRILVASLVGFLVVATLLGGFFATMVVFARGERVLAGAFAAATVFAMVAAAKAIRRVRASLSGEAATPEPAEVSSSAPSPHQTPPKQPSASSTANEEDAEDEDEDAEEYEDEDADEYEHEEEGEFEDETETDDEGGDEQHDISPLTPTALDELERLEHPRGDVRQGLWVLAASLFLFVGAELTFEGSVAFVGYLIVVLAFHEAGHWVAMKAFGYRDLKVFFIPFLGAAVSGRHHRATGAQRAIVSLAGPVPGIVLGLVLAVGIQFGWPVPEQLVLMMFGINAFNLLPIEPLDGGRLMNTLVYHRFPRAEAAIRGLGLLGLLMLAIDSKDWILGIFAGMLVVGLPRTIRIAMAARQLRLRLDEDERAEPFIVPSRRVEVAYLARDEVLQVEAYQRPKSLARTMTSIWERAAMTPPSTGATVALLAFYLLVVGGLVAMGSG